MRVQLEEVKTNSQILKITQIAKISSLKWTDVVPFDIAVQEQQINAKSIQRWQYLVVAFICRTKMHWFVTDASILYWELVRLKYSRCGTSVKDVS